MDQCRVMSGLSDLVYELEDKDTPENIREIKRRVSDVLRNDTYEGENVAWARLFVNNTAPNDNAALVVLTGTDVYIAFRGTVSRRNWWQDISIGRSDFPLPQNAADDAKSVGRAHSGFLSASESLWPRILKRVRTAEQTKNTGRAVSGRRLWLTGHSLGGAMALITGFRLLEEGFDVHGMHVFGAVAPFDKAISSKLSHQSGIGMNTFHVKYTYDVIPKLPLWAMGYHTGALDVWLKSAAVEGTSSGIWGHHSRAYAGVRHIRCFERCC